GIYRVVVTDSKSSEAGFAITAEATAEVNVISVSNPSGRAIGLNFVGSGTGEWGSSAILGTLAADEVAGIYPIANWNNSANEPYVFNSPAPLLLKETDGSTSAGITAT